MGVCCMQHTPTLAVIIKMERQLILIFTFFILVSACNSPEIKTEQHPILIDTSKKLVTFQDTTILIPNNIFDLATCSNHLIAKKLPYLRHVSFTLHPKSAKLLS